jgi:hypothetical protein
MGNHYFVTGSGRQTMPVLVGRIRGDASSAPEIVIYSVGSDGMEASRNILSLVEAERLILSVRRAISASRPETMIVGQRPAQGSDTSMAMRKHHDRHLRAASEPRMRNMRGQRPLLAALGGRRGRYGPIAAARAAFEEDSESDDGHHNRLPVCPRIGSRRPITKADGLQPGRHETAQHRASR